MAAKDANKSVKFLLAMKSIYGPLPDSDDPKLADWQPPENAEGHRGRYLWTDAFAVVNFLTLHSVFEEGRYLIFATNLVSAVHSTLGYSRDGNARLPGATDDQPLKGGLRIGKHDESGADGDGQYFHYLTVWMFALNRMTLVTHDHWYNEQAVIMAKAVLPHFMANVSSSRPQMFWKLSMDLSHPLVHSEGNLDPIDGYVTYKLLQETSDDKRILSHEIATLKKIVDTKWREYSSSDALDLGMTLWIAHWLSLEEDWAATISHRAITCLRQLVEIGAFERPTGQRLAFREFGAAFGVGVALNSMDEKDTAGLRGFPDLICNTWEEYGLVPSPTKQQRGRTAELMPITAVMYASALIPGIMGRLV